MPEPTLTPGKKSARTKGPKGLKRAGRKAAGTLAIRREVAKALKQLTTVSARLESVRVSPGDDPREQRTRETARQKRRVRGAGKRPGRSGSY